MRIDVSAQQLQLHAGTRAAVCPRWLGLLLNIKVEEMYKSQDNFWPLSVHLQALPSLGGAYYRPGHKADVYYSQTVKFELLEKKKCYFSAYA